MTQSVGGGAFDNTSIISLQEIYGVKGMTVKKISNFGYDEENKKFFPPLQNYGMIDVISSNTNLSIDYVMNNMLGSVGKKSISGDIDIAVDNRIHDIETFLNILLKNIGPENINTAAVTNNQIFTRMQIPNTNRFVQVDFLFGNPDLLKWTYFSPTLDQSRYKGAVRNALIHSIIGNIRTIPNKGWCYYYEGRLVASAGAAYTRDRGVIWGYRHSVSKKGDKFNKTSKRYNEGQEEEFLNDISSLIPNITQNDIKQGYFVSSNPDDISKYMFDDTTPDFYCGFEWIYEHLLQSNYSDDFKKNVKKDCLDILVKTANDQKYKTNPLEIPFMLKKEG